MAQAGAQALIVHRTPSNYENLQLIFELAEASRLPVIFPYPDAGKPGGLLSYGPDVVEGLRHIANQIAQIMRGTNPGDIPFYQPTKFQLVVNLRTAKALASRCRHRSSRAPTR